MPRSPALSGDDNNRSRPGGTTRRGGSGRQAASSPSPDSLADAEIRSYVERTSSRSSALEGVPALSAFQRRMEQYPQLSPESQAQLVQEYQLGVASKTELKGRHSATADRRIRAKIRRGEWAIEHLIGSSFRLVWLICRENAEERYGRDRASELLPDLVAEANVALTEAAQNFDPARGPVFSTYAARVVRDRVRMVLTKEGALRLAPSWSRLKRIASVRVPQLTTELGRVPTEAEVRADLLERCLEWAESKLTPEQQILPDAKRLELKIAKLRKQGMLGAIENLADVMIATQSVDSLDRSVGDEGSSTLGDLLGGGDEAPGAYSPGGFDNVELEQLRESLMGALSGLSDRDREIVLYRYGFADGETWTYAKIAERYGVTAERIRQIEHLVLSKLRAPHAMRDTLAAFLPSQFEEGDDDISRSGPRRGL